MVRLSTSNDMSLTLSVEGKHASWYINRTFFFDVHPPLGKMMIAGMGYITGYNGSFNFPTPGVEFGDHKVMGMRVGCTIIGICIIPIGFLTVWTLTGSLAASTLGSIFLIFDTGFTVINRFILLDPLLIFFMSASILADVKFRSLPPSASFSKEWWLYMTLTGVFLVSTFSVKFVGLFVILYVGLNTAQDLWTILGQTSRKKSDVGRHLVARVVCLIIVPICLYIGYFYIHFLVLSKSGPGDGHFGARFTSTLENNPFHGTAINPQVLYGATISLKASSNFPCAYLHSHPQFYPKGLSNGAHQQMVSNYMHREDNNNFIIRRWVRENMTREAGDEFVRHGDLITLTHAKTGRNLHSHNIPALLSPNHYQVTGYGEDGKGDHNDVWRIEIEDGQVGDVVQTMKSVLRLRHHFLHCLLTCTNENFPAEWGFNQQEIACSPWQRQTREKKGFRKNTWIVEDNEYNSTHLDIEVTKVPISTVAEGFWEKLVHSHRVMLFVNSRLGEDHSWYSWSHQIPIKWPFDIVSQVFSSQEPRIFLLGNPIIWAINLACLLVIPFLLFHKVLKNRQMSQSESKHFKAAKTLFVLWSLNYFPFYLMFRVLYVHHYYPSVYFSCLLSGVLLDWTIKSLLSRLPTQIMPVLECSLLLPLLCVSVGSFWLFSPLVYGMTGDMAKFSNSTYHHLYWTEFWDF